MNYKTPDTYDYIPRNIRTAAAKNGEPNAVSKISKRVGIPTSTLNDKMKNPQRFTIEDLHKICIGLNIEITEIVTK